MSLGEKVPRFLFERESQGSSESLESPPEKNFEILEIPEILSVKALSSFVVTPLFSS